MRDDEYKTLLARERFVQMVGSDGWHELKGWVDEQIALLSGSLERGVVDWDTYQRSVGRLRGLRDVIERPEVVIREADAIENGGTDE